MKRWILVLSFVLLFLRFVPCRSQESLADFSCAFHR